MKLVVWNIGHRATQRKISPLLASAVMSLEPDILVLTEYVHSARCDLFLSELAENGLSHSLMTPNVPGQNQVIVVSRTRLEAGEITAPAIDPFLPSNILHVRQPEECFELLGVRVPWYAKAAEKNGCWDWLFETAQAVIDRPFVLLGDFNTDVDKQGVRNPRIGRLLQQGWQHALPDYGQSYYGLTGSTSRIDHAFVSRHFVIQSAEYVSKRTPYNFSELGDDRFSDHAPLLLDIEAHDNHLDVLR
ncbi:MAG: hypothetical protein JWN14_977 [Chthonomonadales bacterium]|nr:hypothetical protein [Chthonomonadales bacterium]